MTNLELLEYALSGVSNNIDVLERYEEPSEQRSEIIKAMKYDRISIERQIESLSANQELVVSILS